MQTVGDFQVSTHEDDNDRMNGFTKLTTSNVLGFVAFTVLAYVDLESTKLNGNFK